MEPNNLNNLITTFTRVVKEQNYVFSPAAIANIPELQKNLRESINEPIEVIEDQIRKWYINYNDIRDAVFQQELVTRGKVKPQITKPESQEGMKENQIRILEQELEKLKNNQILEQELEKLKNNQNNENREG